MINRNASGKHGPRRIVLLSSAAGLALALLIAGPGAVSIRHGMVSVRYAVITDHLNSPCVSSIT